MVTFSPTNTTPATIRTGTVQSWTVPANGNYLIECWGAQGGAGSIGPGGLGAYRFGEMDLVQGEELRIIVGQAGTIGTGTHEGGGGGGSFVYREVGTELLCAAGGGGGSSQNSAGSNAVITEAGTAGPGGGGAGGTNGNGGAGSHGAGGGGWHTTGGNGSSYPTNPPRPGSACKPGATYDTYSPAGQAYGGKGFTTHNPDGGFGGGGGAHGSNSVTGGAGGGYSGGGGGQTSWQGGGGGGSYVHPEMVGTGGTPGTRTSHGEVIITALNAPPNANPISPINAIIDRTQVTRFEWEFEDPDEGDVQSKFELQVREEGETTPVVDVFDDTNDEFYDLAADTLTQGLAYEWRVRAFDQLDLEGPWSEWTPFLTYPMILNVDNLSSDESHEISAATLTSGTYEWRVQTWDAAEEESPWSTWATFDTNAPPNAPNLIHPVGADAAINYQQTDRFEWEFSDPDSGDTQSRFMLEIREFEPTWDDVSATLTWDDVTIDVTWNTGRKVSQ